MCGRFTLTVDPAELQEHFENYTFPPSLRPLQYRAHPTRARHSKRW